MMKKAFFLFLFILVLGFSGSVCAQTTDLLSANVDVSVIPENPKANESVSVSLVSYSTDINSAKITWNLNGKVVKSGTGEKTFNFSVGDTNTTTALDIIIKTFEGETVTKTLRIRPVDVDLLWQSYGFTPPFYKGKSMFSSQNKITFIALPHMTSESGAEIPAKNLVYKWKNNGTVIDNLSGYGKNTYTLTASLISRPINVGVEVTSLSTGSVGSANITVNPSDPVVMFYKKDPLYGIEFQKALTGTVSLQNSKELIVVGVPLFFGTLNSSAPQLAYKWSINGVRINDDTSQSAQVFRQKEGTVGTSNISLSIENSSKILQYASGNFNLTFGK